MADIPYALKSEFLNPCEEALNAHHEALGSGFNVQLKPGGYSGCLTVTIQPSVTDTFHAEWQTTDITRFPSRIKAAATALRNCGHTGDFRISHDNGTLSIIRGIHERAEK